MLRIRNKLTLAFFPVIVGTLIVISILINYRVKKHITNEFNSATTKIIEQIDNNFNSFFTSIKQNCKYLASNLNIDNNVKNITSYKLRNYPINFTGQKNKIKIRSHLSFGLERKIYNMYKKFAEYHPHSEYIYFGTKYTGYIQWPSNLNTFDDYDPRTRPYYKNALKAKNKVIRTEAYSYGAEKEVIISTAVTVKNSKGKIIGVQGLDVSLKNLTDMIKNINIWKNGYIILVDKKNRILAHPQNNNLNFKNIKQIGIKTKNGKTPSFNKDELILFKNKEKIMNIFKSTKTGLKYIALVSTNELSNRVIKITNIIWIIISRS